MSVSNFRDPKSFPYFLSCPDRVAATVNLMVPQFGPNVGFKIDLEACMGLGGEKDCSRGVGKLDQTTWNSHIG